MTSGPQVTTAVAKVLSALLSHPDSDRYGLELMRDTGHPSGTLYPILVRLQRAGWVTSTWEEIDPAREGRPARRYYRLTPQGQAAAERELADLRRQVFPTLPLRPRAEAT